MFILDMVLVNGELFSVKYQVYLTDWRIKCTLWVSLKWLAASTECLKKQKEQIFIRSFHWFFLKRSIISLVVLHRWSTPCCRTIVSCCKPTNILLHSHAIQLRGREGPPAEKFQTTIFFSNRRLLLTTKGTSNCAFCC